MRPVLGSIGGDPAAVRRLAGTLALQGDTLRALANTMRGLTDPAITTWDSPAGVAFVDRAAAVTSVVERVSRRYAVSAAALRGFAEELADCQAEAEVAQRIHAPAWAEFLAEGDAMSVAEDCADPAVRASAELHRSRMVDAGERVLAAEARHDAAREAFRTADRRCVAVLRGLLDDGLADSRAYDLLTGASGVAGSVSSAAGLLALVVPPAAPVAGAVGGSAGGLQLVADTAVRLAYGDGSWRGIGFTVATSALGGAGSVLKEGAAATNAARIAAAPTRAERRALRLTAMDRVVGSAGAHVRRGFRSPPPAKPPHRVDWTVPPAVRGQWAAAQVEARAMARVRRQWVDDFKRVLGTQGASPRMFLVGVGADAARTVVDKVGTVVGTVEARRDEARREATARRHGERPA